jgi:predicted ATPase
MDSKGLLRTEDGQRIIGIGKDDPSTRLPGTQHFNIAIAGGPGIGKSTLAALAFAKFKTHGYDYDLIAEESRKLRKEFGPFESPFERFYMWRQQEREELRSNAPCGFITDAPLFNLYAGARQYFSGTMKEHMALRELRRMCDEIPADRYGLIVLTCDAYQRIGYKNETGRATPKPEAIERNEIVVNLVRDMWPDKIYCVFGTTEERAKQIFSHVNSMGVLRDQRRTKLIS